MLRVCELFFVSRCGGHVNNVFLMTAYLVICYHSCSYLFPTQIANGPHADPFCLFKWLVQLLLLLSTDTFGSSLTGHFLHLLILQVLASFYKENHWRKRTFLLKGGSQRSISNASVLLRMGRNLHWLHCVGNLAYAWSCNRWQVGSCMLFIEMMSCRAERHWT